ncbi:HAMP domain-containing histidine kinase [Terrimonas sp. NA20]|uniref:histidine kinase n=1 Tax=Terrimonas ginsenosidimutans TaxID=2908004 RepID=A0ABS9KW71_9BACT|nr:HAMP domain-containing sensor histidine kinase [Terrimonas ginsenosidimutans]MCG2616479.1 HAMP domain-containing histidine kinase [Terrimonas ginsenosidimutans]
MKKIFLVIIILISISLIGIILIQLSWLKNMILLKEEQVKEKIDRAVDNVGQELNQYKGSYWNNKITSQSNAPFPDDFTELLRPVTIGKRFTTAELESKIASALRVQQLAGMRFEFILYAGGMRNATGIGTIERVSKNFLDIYEDTSMNHSRIFSLSAPSGSAAENLAVDETLHVVAINWKNFALKELRMPIAMAIFFTVVIIAAFYLTVYTMLRQKKLGEIKNDFINNMTHEFKTPIATISLAVDAMKNEKVLQSREKMSYFSSIIKEENQRMNRQVETILKASQLEKQEVNLNLQPINVNKVIKDVIDTFALQLQEKQGRAEVTLDAENDEINADEVHFSNLINNLVDNAVKYSKENTPILIKISTSSNDKSLFIKVEDNGIGMSKETVKRVFERFYRAHTGNLHNVKGFGLGLSYVKTMVNAHGGEIKVESTLGKGSTFTLQLPLRK